MIANPKAVRTQVLKYQNMLVNMLIRDAGGTGFVSSRITDASLQGDPAPRKESGSELSPQCAPEKMTRGRCSSALEQTFLR